MLICGFAPSAWATAYTFPGSMPGGCSGAAGTYTCGAISLLSADTVTINSPKPATINATSFVTNGAKVNQAGTAADLTINVTGGGLFSNSAGAVINANVTAGYVSSAGASTYGGSITANSTYASFSGPVTIGGNISAKSYVFIGATATRSTVNGSISATTLQVDIYNIDVYGSITAGSYVNLTTNVKVTGNLTANGTYIDIHDGANIGGSLTASSYIAMLSTSSVQQCVHAGTGSILNPAGSYIGSACCGGSCTNTCVSTSPKPPACQTLDHLALTASSSSAGVGSNVIYTITACANAACSSLYTLGVTGNLSISGVTPTYTTGASFSIPSGSSSTTETVQMTAGTATASLTGISDTPNNTPSVFCGMGAAAASGNSCALTVANSFDHLEVTTTSANGVTCTPTTFTIKACTDTGTPCTAYTSGVTGNLVLTGTGGSTTAFTINASSSTTTVSKQITSVGSVAASITSPSPAPTNTPATFCGMGATATSGGSCTLTTADSGFLFNVLDHVSNVQQTVSVSAVKKSDSSLACAPAFASVSKSVTFTCAYTNPATGTLPVLVGGSALNAAGNSAAACDGTGQAVSLSFDATGVASTTVKYADVGQMALNASYSSAGLTMTGSDSFIAAPASFTFSGITAAPIKAGASFAATVTAKNNSGAATPNFGKESSPESVRLTWAKYSPTGTGAASGSLTGNGVSPSAALSGFASGAATASNLSWTEVGTGDLSAALTSGSYLGSGLTATGSTGSTGAVGRFIPDHFDTVISSQACSAGAFTYSGQPFTVQILARNVSGSTTANYDGTANTSPNYAKAVTLSAASNAGTGSLSGAAVALTNFGAGSATITSTPAFTFTNKLTAPTTVSIRATDTDGVSSSTGTTEGSVALRSGRIKMSNAFGTQKSALQVPVQAQYWNGKAWVINSSDSCTVIPAASVALSSYVDSKGASTAAWTTTASAVTMSALTPGLAILTLSAPSASGSGSVDFAFNLGSSTTDQSCLSSHPSSTGANMSWLRAQNGTANACAGVTTYDRDPSARATFGVFSAETKKAVFVRDMY